MDANVQFLLGFGGGGLIVFAIAGWQLREPRYRKGTRREVEFTYEATTWHNPRNDADGSTR